MNTFIRCVLPSCILLYSVLAQSAADPSAAIANCRAKHAENPPEHIACLERELQALEPTRQEDAKSNFGAEQFRAKPAQETVEQTSVEIQNVTYGFGGMAVFRMADGQVWKATESTPTEQRLDPSKTYSARIERGKFGGYRMYVQGVPRMIKVMRMQ
jgi:hypothetical protein